MDLYRKKYARYSEQDLDIVAEKLREGAVLALPTDTVYGLGVLYGLPQALDRLKWIKRREKTKPIPMMCASLDSASSIVQIDERVEKIAHHFLPGPLTLVLPLQPDADRLYTDGKPTAALRIPDTPVLLELMQKLDHPLLVTSANLSGEPPALSWQQAVEMLPDLDGVLLGNCVEMEASTIVDCTEEQLKVLRKGPISLEEILEVLDKEEKKSC